MPFNITVNAFCVWQIVHKRKIAIAKAQGDMSIVVDYLNKYLEL